MKYSILLISFFLFFGKTSAQTDIYFSNDTLDQIIRYGFYYEDSHYFITHSGEWHIPSGSLLYETEGYNCYLIKLDSSLNVNDSLLFEPLEGYLLNAKKVLVLDDTIYASGRAIKPDNSDEQIFFNRYTMDFQLIDYSLFGDTSLIEIMSDIIINDKNNFVISSMITTQSYEDKYFILFECNKHGDLLRSVTDTSWHLEGAYCMQLPESKKYHFIDMFHISIYDSTLTLQNTFFPNYFNQLLYMYQNTYYENDKYFIGGIAAQGYGSKSNFDNALGSHIDITYYLLDDQAKSVDSGYIYLPDTIDFCNGLDYSSSGNLCYGGTHDAYFGPEFISGFEQDYRWLVVKNLNYETQNENWFFRYGGDANYYMYGLYLTPDNECIVYSTRYDWHNADSLERDILIIKIDSTGTLVGNNTSISMVQFCKVYPNPGSNQLNIEVVNLEGHFELFDMHGVRVISESFVGSYTSISTDFLKSGVYFYKITDTNNEKINIGKWVKH